MTIYNQRSFVTFVAISLAILSALDEQKAVWPEKNCQISIKVAQKDFARKMIDFDTFTKIP